VAEAPLNSHNFIKIQVIKFANNSIRKMSKLAASKNHKDVSPQPNLLS